MDVVAGVFLLLRGVFLCVFVVVVVVFNLTTNWSVFVLESG